VEVEDRLQALEGEVESIKRECRFLIKPLLLELGAQHTSYSPASPGMFRWICDEFYRESDFERRRYLKRLYDELRDAIPAVAAGHLVIEDLPEPVEPREIPDSIFER
jgi:hypothetical protein